MQGTDAFYDIGSFILQKIAVYFIETYTVHITNLVRLFLLSFAVFSGFEFSASFHFGCVMYKLLYAMFPDGGLLCIHCVSTHLFYA